MGQGVITSHFCVAPRLKVAAYAISTPHFSTSSLLDLQSSDALLLDTDFRIDG